MTLLNDEKIISLADFNTIQYDLFTIWWWRTIFGLPCIYWCGKKYPHDLTVSNRL